MSYVPPDDIADNENLSAMLVARIVQTRDMLAIVDEQIEVFQEVLARS